MNTQTAIKFYIIVPVYQAQAYIHPCVRSVLDQTYSHYEAIFVDDGSPDDCGAILDEYAEKEPAIRVLHKKNEGQISARQAGVSYVKRNCSEENAYFIFLDSDDYLQPDALQIIAGAIGQHSCDLVFYRMQSVCDGRVVRRPAPASFTGVLTEKRELYRRVFFSMEYNSMCCKAIACALMEDTDWRAYYGIRYGEDLLQSIPIFQLCSKAVFLADVLYNYTVNPHSVTHSVDAASYQVDSTVRKTVWEFLHRENVFTEQDFYEYLQKCRGFLRTVLLSVVGTRAKRRDLMRICQDFAGDGYNAMLLEPEQEDKVLGWLKHGRYGRIIGYARRRALRQRIIHWIKMIRK